MQIKIDTFAEMPKDTGIESIFTGTKIVVPEKKEIEKGQFQAYNINEDWIINNIYGIILLVIEC